MAWRIEFTPEADRLFGKLGRNTQEKIQRYLRKQVSPLENPRQRGEALAANLSGLWRYRVGDYRIICRIIDEKVTVLVIKVGHRKEVYSQ